MLFGVKPHPPSRSPPTAPAAGTPGSYYRELYGYRPADFPVAFAEYQRALSLPIYSKMTDTDVQDVIDAVLEIVAAHRR